MKRMQWGFENLEIWQIFLKHNETIYTKITPHSKVDWDLVRQLRRAMVSVGLNIAEGYSRKNLKEKIQFLNIAKASLNEVKACLIIIETIAPDHPQCKIIDPVLSEIKTMDAKLLYLMRYFESKTPSSSK
jgi:four helix bundle protein